ncbi:hypothetical protein Verru16b_00171 [Lacunisphaera limnophila]|uniref:Uncharacterized protein n=1 Tax=Lacunisphaera limnophila TaxID=1838286 RepID=A0A1I7PHP1_9BACT|nr:hypothetical protein [Lacunisphaera limnophila]AOS43130.1 hypothetical protein Verru16b_00171 [Lacunisphaera limnophila]
MHDTRLQDALAPSTERGVAPRGAVTPGPGARIRGLMLLALALLGLAGAAHAAGPKPEGEFGKDIQLAPFVVKGKALTISIHARSKGDRRYAEQFAEAVVKVVYEAVTEETGKGLVIIGKKGEPHPVFVFRQFLALAQEGKLDPAVAARAPELNTMLHHWENALGDGTVEADETEGTEPPDLEFEQIIAALPLPLEGIGAQLYQLAWRENFDPAKVEARWRALRPADLEGSLFARFDWVFYLPPRGAFEQAVDRIIADALKEEEVGFVARTFVKGVLMAVKPAIRRAIEALRRGVLFSAVVGASTDFNPGQVETLMGAYVNAIGAKEKGETGTEHERAVRAVRAAIASLPAAEVEPETVPAAPEAPAEGS